MEVATTRHLVVERRILIASLGTNRLTINFNIFEAKTKIKYFLQKKKKCFPTYELAVRKKCSYTGSVQMLH